MAKLIYLTNMSLDGFIEDRSGRFDWLPVDAEVFTFLREWQRSIGTCLYGRRLYESMVVWETLDAVPDAPFTRGFAEVWRAAEKVVYSTTLEKVSSARTRIERAFDADFVRHLKASAERDISVGGANLAAQAIKAGLVDEIQLMVFPVVVGAGKPALLRDVRLHLELLSERRFANGVVHLRYRPPT